MAVQKNHFDIIIVGGGPAGLTLGLSLATFMPGLEIAICERTEFAVPQDARAYAIAAGVARVFDSVGAWAGMAPAAAPIMRMRITDSGTGDRARPLFLSFEGDVAPGEPYAHMVPNRVVVSALLERLGDKVRLIAPTEIVGMDTAGGRAELALKDGGVLSAPLIVAADGVRSLLRSMAGIGTVGHAYGQSGIVTTIRHELDHAQTAYEHFRPAGPFASLPLPGRQSSLVWTEKTEEAERLRQMDPGELAPIIETAMGSVLGSVEVIDNVQAFPLRLQIAREFHGQRLALIGDAAHVVHPIAGQGLNLGLKDVAALTEVLIDAIRLGQDHGAEDVLVRYTRWRRFDTALMAMVTDGLNRLFSNDVAPVRAARDLGLGVVDRLPGLKSTLIRHAAGIGGDMPKMMRGMTV